MECIWMERVILIIMAPLPVFHLIYFSAMWYLWWKNTWYLESSKSEYLLPTMGNVRAYKQESLFFWVHTSSFFIFFYSFPLGFVFLFFNILKNIYFLFLAVLGLHCSMASSWGNQGYSLDAVPGLLISMVSLLLSTGSRHVVQLLWPMGLVALRHVRSSQTRLNPGPLHWQADS